MTEASFVGLDNFKAFFSDPRAKQALGNTIQFGVATPILFNVVGLALALLLNKPFRGRNLVRAIVYSPSVISSLIMGYVWLFILKPGNGILSQMLKAAGAGADITLLNSGTSALWTVVACNVWQFVGLSMILYLAGLQAIPTDVVEASMIDGAYGAKRFFRVTLPMLIPSVKVSVIINIIGGFSVFDIMMAITGGGPGYATETLSIYIYRMCFGNNTGYSTAVALILFLVILVPVVISMKIISKSEDE